MIYCIGCGDDAGVCFCGSKKQTAIDYVDSPVEEVIGLGCYCKRNKPK